MESRTVVSKYSTAQLYSSLSSKDFVALEIWLGRDGSVSEVLTAQA